MFSFTLSLLIGSCFNLCSARGSLSGKVTDKETGEPIMFGNVVIYQGDFVDGGQTDFDGNYNISGIKAGSYKIEVSYVGYTKGVIDGVNIQSGKIRKLDVQLQEGNELIEVVVEWERPLIEVDNTSGGSTFDAKEIKNLATRDVGSVQNATAGLTQKDPGRELNANGDRSSGNLMVVDGVVMSSANVPESEIEQISIITSGFPARYGDMTGALTTITTKGISSKVRGQVAAESSQYLDAFGHNRVDFSISGPLYK